MEAPETRYVKNDDTHLAYAVMVGVPGAPASQLRPR